MSSDRRTPPVAPDGRKLNASEEVGEGRVSGSDSPSIPMQFSSSTPSPTGKGGNYRMNTIDSAGDVYGSSDLPIVQPPPTHTMFNSLYDDSDGSDGSIVFNNQKKTAQGRERFPSFDSMASSGSLVRHAPQHRGNVPSPQAPKVTQQNMAHVNPQLLPYDQRRKLMKLKKQQQQQQPQRDRSPQARPHDDRYMPYMMPPPEFQQHTYNTNHMHPPPQHFVYPMQYHPMPMPVPLGAYPSPHNPRLSPYRSAQPPRFDQSRPNSGTKPPGPGRRHPPPQPPTPPLHSLPPRNAGISTRDRLPHSNSIDSSDQDAPGQARARNPIPSSQSDPSNATSNTINPPPPPPPPPVPPHHVRAESTGSVSSLGSQGSIFGYFASNDNEKSKNRGERGNDFLKMLNPFSAKNAKRAPKETKSEFHRKNQYFLKQSATERQKRQSPAPQHRRVGSMDRPPASRGTHKRLPSIENDDWAEPHSNLVSLDRSGSEHSSTGSQLSSSEDTEDGKAFGKDMAKEEANERTFLLLPSGQGSSEQVENKRGYRHSDNVGSSRRRQKQRSSRRGQMQREIETSVQRGSTSSSYEPNRPQRRSQKKYKNKKNRRRSRRNRNTTEDGLNSPNGSDQNSSSSSSSYDYRQWTRRRAQMLEDERSRLIAQWKAEARAEALASRRQRDDEQWHRRLGRYIDSEFGFLLGRAYKVLCFLEAFICNLPLTVGAIAMAVVTLGVAWEKFTQELLCEPVQFHSSQCAFPEFPGCFFCDVTDPNYRIAVNFRLACSTIAGTLALSFILKMLLATQVVLDEMSSPTTASPAGLICMTIVCVFAGHGFVGQLLVSIAACLHLVLVIWFIYMALAYHIMPDPSWFPNTVGIGISAVKTWLYYPMSGHFLMAISLSLNFFFFPISLIRVALNEKISATVAYMQMSAPAISLYALTIMAQPSFEQEKPDINRFQRAHRLVYLPAMHFLFALSCIGFLASIQSLVVRRTTVAKQGFSPAHAAFCFPTLLHANSIQAYRAAINSFSNEPPGSPFKLALDVYWILVLIGGTSVTLWITAKFFYYLPSWINIETHDETEPPAPFETTMTLQNVIATGESLVQPFISPAVLQANETGALVLVRRSDDGGRQRFVRTRKLAALGFEPIMSWSEMEMERDLLLDWILKHPPRHRNRTLSVPGIDFKNYEPDLEGADLDYGGRAQRTEASSQCHSGGAYH